MADERLGGADFPGRLITPTFANQFYLIVGGQTTRVTLGEFAFSDVPANYSSAIVLPTEVAIDMAQKIIQLATEQGLLKPAQAIPTSPLSGLASLG